MASRLDQHERDAIRAATRDAIDAVTKDFERGAIERAEWQRRVADILGSAYLRDDDPRWQSGFDGDERLWRAARSLVLSAAPTTGSFLDVGCANGHLLESLAEWARERGQTLDFYGLELNPALAAEARRRLPAFADRIYTGNVSDWIPPRRFTCIRTGLEYAPPGERATMIARIARDLVDIGGRVLVGPVNDDAVVETRETFASAELPDATVVSATDHRGKTRHVVWSFKGD
jgi:SAM-dependent methyltransferase